jgi:hypothetical protein
VPQPGAAKGVMVVPGTVSVPPLSGLVRQLVRTTDKQRFRAWKSNEKAP